MKKILFALLVLSMLVLAGCKSAFKLPAGCEDSITEASNNSSAPQTPTVAVSADSEKTNASVKETTETAADLKETDSTLNSVGTPSDKNSDNLPVKTVTEGGLISFPKLKAVDPDGDKIAYTFSQPLDANGKWQTKVGDAGEYFATITASDGKTKATQKVKLVVIAKNRPPVIEDIAAVVVNEGDTVKLAPVVTDPEGDDVAVAFSGWMDTDTKSTKFGDAGKYVVTVTANDGTSTATKKVTVIVKKVNRAPVLESIDDVVIKEGDKITVKPVAHDADNDKLSFKFSKPLDSDGVWQTKLGDAGTYTVDVTVSDGALDDKTNFKVTVQSINRPPVLTVKEAEINVDEGDIVTIHAEATDADNDPVRISYSGWMTSNTYKTNYDDQGVHTVTVTATDGINTVSKDVQVVVRNVNRPPVFDAGSFS